mmetsp:Transcript_4643/g.6039  ORF Transcript_4643/g.6039 Transcript_4643/m.6039 type:complete len:646 (-) Transcript_4643:176-2113(-)
MGQSPSCFTDNTDGKNGISRQKHIDILSHPLSSQDSEIDRSIDYTSVATKSGSGSGGGAEASYNVTKVTTKDTDVTRISRTFQEDKSYNNNNCNSSDNVKSAGNWHPFSSSDDEEEEENMVHSSDVSANRYNVTSGNNSSKYYTNQTVSPSDNSDYVPTPYISSKNGKLKNKKQRFRWKRKDAPKKNSQSISNGIVTLRLDPSEKKMYYFAQDKSQYSRQSEIRKRMSCCASDLPIATYTDINQTNDKSKNRNNNNNFLDSKQKGKGINETIPYTGSEVIATKIATKDILEVKRAIMKKMTLRGKKDILVDPVLLCGTQIYARRYIVNNGDDEGDNMKRIHISSEDDNLDVNPVKVNNINDENLSALLKRNNMQTQLDSVAQKEGKGGLLKAKKALESRVEIPSTVDSVEKGELLSAIVPHGIARKIFTDRAVTETSVNPVEEVICVSSQHQIYICDIGLTSSRCDFIVDTSERCAKGSYNAYTYAKQTLGCREFDELSVVCEWPVMRAISTIREHLEKVAPAQSVSLALNQERAPRHVKLTERNLTLDDREPHIVKYDVSRRERQKLDIHTDKSEWTFLIALTDGGYDYDGGGTYFECIDSTVHLEKGHALIFPGKLRHRGQKIVSGTRFLLVGFLIEKEGVHQ